MKRAFNAHGIVDQLTTIYDESVANLRQALARYVEDGTPPDARARKNGSFAYPELRIDYGGKLPATALSRAFVPTRRASRHVTSRSEPARRVPRSY